MILAIWNCYSLPLDVAFEPDAFNSSSLNIFNTLIDICFMLDILVNFRTTFVNPRTGDEIVSPKTIALTYIKGRFWVDLVAAIPLDKMLLGQVE